MKISGCVEDIIFKNSDNGYTVLNIDYNGSLLTCVGKCLSVNVGEDVELEGQFVKNISVGKFRCKGVEDKVNDKGKSPADKNLQNVK